jgi:hypothetical protein
MPLDSVTTQAPQTQDWGLNRVQSWKLKLCWLPGKCFISGTPLWGKLAYHGIRWMHGPGEPVEVIYWIDKHEFLLWQLKQ